MDNLWAGLVLGTTEQDCTVHAAGRTTEVPYAAFFPAPRAERVSPGHLVAVAGGQVVWRWFDAVVVGVVAGVGVELFEPGHGLVVARPRRPGFDYGLGSRAYLSAGLPGAEWWVAGPAVDRSDDAQVELGELDAFLTANGLRG